jgi:hypothetical protein
MMMGYLWYDSIFEFSYSKQTDTLVHHVLGLVSHLSSRLSDNGAAKFYSMVIYFAELSTPFLHLSWLMHQLQMKHSLSFKLCVFLLLVSFLVARVALGPSMIAHMLRYRHQWGPDTLLLFWGNFSIVSAFAVLNFFWFYKLVRLAIK